MKVLIVANYNKGYFVPFIIEQVNALKCLGVKFDYFGIQGKGISGYLSNLSALKSKIRIFQPDLIHAHYGLSGLFANLQRNVPVVTTFHGSDIHSGGRNLLFSRIAMLLSEYSIFVSEKLKEQAGRYGSKQCIVPCGVDTNIFHQTNRNEARKMLNWDVNGKYALFAGAFNNRVKNCELAKAAIAQIHDAQLVEMHGFSRQQVNLALNAANCLLMTSHHEGSPQVVKEALACGTPIVSVDVGDVAEITTNIEGCYVTKYELKDIISGLEKAFSFQGRTNGRERIIQRNLSNDQVAKKILSIYREIEK